MSYFSVRCLSSSIVSDKDDFLRQDTKQNSLSLRMTMFLQPHLLAEAVRVESVFFLIQEHYSASWVQVGFHFKNSLRSEWCFCVGFWFWAVWMQKRFHDICPLPLYLLPSKTKFSLLASHSTRYLESRSFRWVSSYLETLSLWTLTFLFVWIAHFLDF